MTARSNPKLGAARLTDRRFRHCARVLLVALMLGVQSVAQFPDPSLPSSASSDSPAWTRHRSTPYGQMEDPLAASRRIKKLNEIRQKALVAETEKLLRLARELNAAVSDKDSQMSAEERLRRVAEIEKLAKDVKSKMIFSFGVAPDPFFPPLSLR